MFVKICGLSTREALAAAIDAGADAVGFVLADSVRRVPPEVAAELAADVPSHVLKVAVMRHPSPSACRALFDAFTPDWLQTDVEDFAGIELPAGCRALPVVRHDTDRERLPDRILFEGQKSGSGTTADWAAARRLAGHCELILAGGLDASNIANAVARVDPWGVDVSSGVESAPGIKSPQKILEFVSRVRELEQLR